MDPAPLLVLLVLVEANALLVESGSITFVARRLEKMGRKGVFLLTLVSEGLSAVLLKDAVVLQAASILWNLPVDEHLKLILLTLLLAAVNVGSSIGPYGSPQNTLIFHHMLSLPAYSPVLLAIAIAVYFVAPRGGVEGIGCNGRGNYRLAFLGFLAVSFTIAGGLTEFEWLGAVLGILLVAAYRFNNSHFSLSAHSNNPRRHLY